MRRDHRPAIALSVAFVTTPLWGGTTIVKAADAEARVSLEVSKASLYYGEAVRIGAAAQFYWTQCPLNLLNADIYGTFRFLSDGTALGPASSRSVVVARCDPPGGWAAIAGTNTLGELGFGTHRVAAEFSGNANTGAATSSMVDISVAPHFEAPLPDGGTLKLAASSPIYNNYKGECDLLARVGTFGAPGWPAQAPPNAKSISALFSTESTNCQWQPICYTLPGQTCLTTPVARRLLVERESDLPPGTVAWAYGPTAENATPHWYELRTAASGRSAYFEVVDGGSGDNATTPDGRILATIALGVPTYSAVGGRYQDLWWAGPQENGWGLSITQHRDALFGELFIYDAQGTARWLVMPSGQWNAAKTAFTGAVYRPRGAPFAATYDASRFAIGAPVGTLTLTPASLDAMRLDYVIDGARGSRQLSRIPFGPPTASPTARLDDLWWGGVEENGWGLVIAQQHRTLFAIWYTYDANGDATWYVAPNVQSYYDGLLGGLYRPRGSPWIGVSYDASRHALESVGAITVGIRDSRETGVASFVVGNVQRSVPITRLPF